MTRKRFLISSSLVLFLIVCSTSYVVTIRRDRVDYETVARNEIVRFKVLVHGIIRGGQPTEEGFKILKKYYKVKTILNLRSEKEQIEWERKFVKGLGMDFVNIPMDGRKEQSIEKIEICLDIIADRSRQPIFAHCKAGKDRTGLVFAAYRIKYDGWDFEKALSEMLAFEYDEAKFYNLKKSLIDWNNYIQSERVK